MFVILDVVRDGRLAWLSMQLNLTPVIIVDHPFMLCMFVHGETFYSAHNNYGLHRRAPDPSTVEKAYYQLNIQGVDMIGNKPRAKGSSLRSEGQPLRRHDSD